MMYSIFLKDIRMSWFENDKTIVIGGAVILGTTALLTSVFFSETVMLAAISLVGSIVTGMFGVAVGVKLEQRKKSDE